MDYFDTHQFIKDLTDNGFSESQAKALANQLVTLFVNNLTKTDKVDAENKKFRLGPIYPCPITGCQTKFFESRGGWDGHVGAPRMHPDWHPQIKEPEERKKQFEDDFPKWSSTEGWFFTGVFEKYKDGATDT